MFNTLITNPLLVEIFADLATDGSSSLMMFCFPLCSMYVVFYTGGDRASRSYHQIKKLMFCHRLKILRIFELKFHAKEI